MAQTKSNDITFFLLCDTLHLQRICFDHKITSCLVYDLSAMKCFCFRQTCDFICGPHCYYKLHAVEFVGLIGKIYLCICVV